MVKLSVKEIADATGGRLVGEDCFADSVCTDNRLAKPNCLFVAIAGENHDGHDYAAAACSAGAAAVLVQRDLEDVSCAKIIVPDTKKALGLLASYYLKKLGVRVLAVTGSVGKTTTRNMAHAAVAGAKNAVKTIKNFNNDIGLPLTVLTQVDSETELAVLEMGMNHFGEIAYLSEIAEPEAAIITNIGMSHIENLGSQEGILKAKLEVTRGLKKDGLLILNGDDDYLLSVKDSLGYNVKWFSVKDNSADFYAENIKASENGVSFDLCSAYGRFKVNLNVLGEHNVKNALASFAAAMHFGVSPEDAVGGLESFFAGDMRMEIIKKSDFDIINDCYNASPDSMRAAIDVLFKMERSEKIAVLGDMLEMGSFAPDAHRAVGVYAAQKSDLVICTGELGKYIKEGAGEKGIWLEDKKEVLKKLDEVKEGSCILIKASRGMHFEELTKGLLEK